MLYPPWLVNLCYNSFIYNSIYSNAGHIIISFGYAIFLVMTLLLQEI